MQSSSLYAHMRQERVGRRNGNTRVADLHHHVTRCDLRGQRHNTQHTPDLCKPFRSTSPSTIHDTAARFTNLTCAFMTFVAFAMCPGNQVIFRVSPNFGIILQAALAECRKLQIVPALKENPKQAGPPGAQRSTRSWDHTSLLTSSPVPGPNL
jgi:hypothetical protein